MSLAIVYSRAQIGLDAPLVTVEVHLTGGLPSLSIVGLPEAAVKESKDRVRSAIINARFEFPARRITINLAPADLPKEGGRFDLPIALGILAASGQIPIPPLASCEFLGELALTGAIRPVRSALPAALQSRAANRQLLIPRDNADEAGLAEGAQVLPAGHLLEVCGHLTQSQPITAHHTDTNFIEAQRYDDLCDVRGQYQARRALEIAASGRHNLLLVGPPGTGKTMLALRLPGILPPMSEDEALELAAICSVSTQAFDTRRWRRRPFRAPHHTASAVALVGGGSHPKPGEISLAHHGILFLDELPEFDRRVLEVLREPLESGRITISRAARQAEFPARFQLVAAMNPCPCGYLGDGSDRCQCSAEKVLRYRAKVSGPLLDRIDMHVEVPRARRDGLESNAPAGESSAAVRARVEAGRARQHARCGKMNSAFTPLETETHCKLSEPDGRLLDAAIERLGLSERGRHRVLRVARTIADLADSEQIESKHLTEALGYRGLDRAPPATR